MNKNFSCEVCGEFVEVDDDWETCTQVCQRCGTEHGVQLKYYIEEVWIEIRGKKLDGPKRKTKSKV